MARVYGIYGPAHPWLGGVAYAVARPILTALFASQQFYRPESAYARQRSAALQARLRSGEKVYLLGIGPSGHNAGVALVAVSLAQGITLICNEEEERYAGIKHFAGYPEQSIAVLKRRMAEIGIGAHDLHACLASWNYVEFLTSGARWIAEHFPTSMALNLPGVAPNFNSTHAWRALGVPQRLGRQLGLGQPMPIIGMRHHDNHAAFAYGVSPFNHNPEPIMVCVLDAHGDDGSISLYVAQDCRLRRVYTNASLFDSLGMIYSIISSTQGGWTSLSSEGRYMGATAWGNNDRLTNPYYRQLRQLVYFGNHGQILLNRALADWHRWGEIRPYTPALKEILGAPIPPKQMWNPDAVLHVEDIQHSPITQERLDKAAATQLLFEDVLFHIVGHLIRTTGSDKLVLAGGTALNCVANMRLLEHFDESFYRRYLRKPTYLHIWVPPTPNDAGAAMGAAYNFALSNGVPAGASLTHAFYCGLPPSTAAMSDALGAAPDIGFLALGNIEHPDQRAQIADFAAYIVAQDGVLGLFQGAAETGPRALGHRSIVANPCNPRTLENINALVKYRERIRPLAPMATYTAAQQYFELAPGAADDEHNAYNYMVLSARARPASYTLIPAVIHHDGTARVQIVREASDPFTYAFLKAMGRRLGVELAVNTSLNVGSPIVQTPAQALDALRRSRGLSGLLMIGAAGDAFLAWHNVVAPPKDAGRRLLGWHRAWQQAVSPISKL
jgi:carbamoyltransferase